MENDLTRIVESLPGLIWTASPDGEIDYLNHRWYEYTGIKEGEVCSRIWQIAIHPEDIPGVFDRWGSLLVTGEPRDMEARLRRFDGEYRWFVFRASPIADASGQVIKWCGVNIDINDRKRSEEALKTRENHLLAIADGIPALIAFMTPDGKVENANRHVREYFGARIEELKGWATTAIVHPEDLPAVTAAWMRSMEKEEPYDSEHRMRRADGVYRWFHVRALPLRDVEGRIAHWYCLQTGSSIFFRSTR